MKLTHPSDTKKTKAAKPKPGPDSDLRLPSPFTYSNPDKKITKLKVTKTHGS
jgi:hypothetical protein